MHVRVEMRPDAEARNSTMGVAAEADGVGFRGLKSPLPYLFGGLAFMLTLIALALLILACSYRKYSSSSSSSQEKQSETVDMESEANSEPKIVVIMAGDTNPTYLAKPLSSSAL